MEGMAKYNRRFRAHGASGIGNWLPMMEILAFICIPVNVGIIMYTGRKECPEMLTGQSENSSFRNLLAATKRNTDGGIYMGNGDQIDWHHEKYWGPVEILWLGLIVEHCYILLKFLLATLISDVPISVKQAETKRVKIIEAATLKLDDIRAADPTIVTYEDHVR